MKNLQLTSLMLIGLLSGCASVHQTFISKEKDNDSTHGPYGYKSKVYAGTKTDASIVSICFAGTGWGFITCPFALLAAIDMPFSIVGDTLFLPYTLTGKQRNDNLKTKCIEYKRLEATNAQKNGESWKDDDIWCAKSY
jgi:uncharacterized protein YceK